MCNNQCLYLHSQHCFHLPLEYFQKGSAVFRFTPLHHLQFIQVELGTKPHVLVYNLTCYTISKQSALIVVPKASWSRPNRGQWQHTHTPQHEEHRENIQLQSAEMSDRGAGGWDGKRRSGGSEGTGVTRYTAGHVGMPTSIPKTPHWGEKKEGQRGRQTEAPWGAGEEEPCTMSPAPVVSSFDFDE